jgi:hypothetical protein
METVGATAVGSIADREELTPHGSDRNPEWLVSGSSPGALPDVDQVKLSASEAPCRPAWRARSCSSR